MTAVTAETIAERVLVEAICSELHDLIVSELEHAAKGARLFGQDSCRWIHERGNMIESLIRASSQVNR